MSASMVNEKPLSEASLLHLLSQRFASPAFAFMPHVRNGTGFTRKTTRAADALALGLWPSRGLDLHGFEIKSARQDWMRELAAPDKAEEICRFCDRWWVVIGREDIVQPGELPATWGLLIPRGDKLAVKVEAPKLDPKPIDRPMLCAILRAATETMVPKSTIEAQVEERAKAAEQRAYEIRDFRLKQIEQNAEQLRKSVADFEESSGVKINHWDGGYIGKAVRRFLDLSHCADSRTELERHRNALRHAAEHLDAALDVSQTGPTHE